jgi:hypothetical protein
MEVQREPLAALLQWAAGAPLVQRMWQRFGAQAAASPAQWAEAALQELVGRGALASSDDGVVSDR